MSTKTSRSKNLSLGFGHEPWPCDYRSKGQFLAERDGWAVKAGMPWKGSGGSTGNLSEHDETRPSRALCAGWSC